MKTFAKSFVLCAGLLISLGTTTAASTPLQPLATSAQSATSRLVDLSSAATTTNQHQSAAYEAAYLEGVQEAEAEIAQEKPTLYVFGKQADPYATIDAQTKLPRQAIAGCVVDDSILGRAAGHNERIQQYLNGQSLSQR